MKVKKILSIILLCAMTVLMLAGCGNGNKNVADPADTSKADNMAGVTENIGSEMRNAKKMAETAGKYYVKTINDLQPKDYLNKALEGSDTTLEDATDELGLDLNNLDEMITIELKEDGTVVFAVFNQGAQGGTWSVDGDTLSLRLYNGQPKAFTIKNGEIIGNENDMEIVMVKK